jgi:hypothetical protein
VITESNPQDLTIPLVNMPITSKGKTWEIRHSLWIGWTFTLGFFNWIAFLYIGLRARRKKWIFWGLFYSVPFTLAMLTPDLDSPLGNLIVFLTLALGVAGILHAFRVRKEYLIRLEALQRKADEAEMMLRRRPEIEYETATSSQRPTTSEQINRDVLHRDKGGPSEPSDESTPSSPSASSKPPSINVDETPEHKRVAASDAAYASPNIQSGNELEYRISSSYPFPVAFGFRSLMSIVDPRDLYREQLRIAENMLAFLASVSLTLLREEDREKAGIYPREYWLTGISPGDWKDIVGRCSKVFAEYQNNPLALAIYRLNIRLDKKGFGHDIAKLIQAKNDYKHDRGPFVLEDIAGASKEVQDRLKRCMEAIAFFVDYPIRQVEDFNVSRSGNEFFLKCLRYVGDHPSFPQEEVIFHRGLRRGDLFLEQGVEDWVPLYPFIVPMTCTHCKARETYFIDSWDQRRSMARMKSFERGHTMNNPGVSESLAEWENTRGASVPYPSSR